MKIKKGDTVKITSGNDKGKTGKVIRAFGNAGKIVVEGVNIRKKHVRPKRQGQKGEIVRIPAPFLVSRAMLLCPKCGKLIRPGMILHEDSVKVRICKKCSAEI
ncbi:MAG: 50S ribosomal protein L24 [Candidatus Sungbacteria bacterium]|nr:50S ribosomal protein L24 [Candidatus Sungbacteria bacterium]